MAKKPAITGIGRPQGFIDDVAKAIGKAIKKPKSVKVTKPLTRKPPQPPKRVVTGKPPSVGSKGTGREAFTKRNAMSTEALDKYRKMQGFDKTVNDIKKPKKRIG
jgi:hypothetical protein